MRKIALGVAVAILLLLPITQVAAQPSANRCNRPSPPPACSKPTPTPTVSPTVTPTPSPTPPTSPKLLFGLGPEADGALRERLYADAQINMLSSWFNSPNDLVWMTGWENDLVPQAYARGEALHLIIYNGDGVEGPQNTVYGPACGKPYPISSRFANDMQQLAFTFRPRDADDRLYVTVFTEFQTYACTDNTWVGQENYYRALKDNYRVALSAFHAVGGKVSIGWGGWQSRWDDPANGAGRSMIPNFADIMNVSDFVSFQAMQGDTNVTDIRNMSDLLNDYGPVMLAHYLPDGGICPTYDADTHALFTDANVADLVNRRLFAWSFMGPDCLLDATRYAFIRDSINRYAAP